MRAWPLLVLVAGCESFAEPDLADTVREATARMHQRFAASTRMQHAIALGQLDRAREEARTIAALDEPDMIPDGRERIDRIRTIAREVAAAKDTIAAARGSARLGLECARCHETSKARIAFGKTPAPPTSDKLAPQMASHAWAAARMWEGLIAPDEERWRAGAKQLSEAKIDIAAETGTLGIADDVSRMVLLARRATRTQALSDRAELYGELLGTCAHCHFVIRD